jgi:hypothetical protein
MAARIAALVALLGLAAAISNDPSASPRRLRTGQQPQQDKVLVAHSKHISRRHGFVSRRSATPEQLEAWKDSGSAVKSNLAAADLLKLSTGITSEAFAAQLHALVDPEPTRFIATKGNDASAANIKKIMDGLGLRTEIQSMGIQPSLFQYTGGPRTLPGNVIGYLQGTDRADEVVIVGCHYDSVNWDDISGPAPGVDDNGSGVALMLLLAKALSQSATKPRRSVLFVSFQAEEEGLVGSKAFAELFKPGASGHAHFGKPVAAIVADEVAWPGKTAADRKVIFETKGQGKATNIVVDSLAHAAQQQCSAGVPDCVNGFVVNYHGFGSDHIPMLDVGIPAVLLIERDNMFHADKWGHTAEDTFKHIDTAFGAATTRLALQAVGAMANPSD